MFPAHARIRHDADTGFLSYGPITSHLLGNLKRKPATINNALAAIDDFYTRLGLGDGEPGEVLADFGGVGAHCLGRQGCPGQQTGRW